MPRVKIDYVVSFSSEDPEHPANNLLNREVSKKKWLCKKGESSCSVVLQLPRAVKISAVHIGAYNAALVEVLVGRSESSSEKFQVLVASSVFVSREECRRDVPTERVRSFGAGQLGAPAAQRWDRLRIVCSQPYNKHCKYGLSFVHVDEAEEGAAPGAGVPARLLALDSFSSDEDEFKPGELFAKHLLNKQATDSTANTSAQIRQATSQALKNISESSTKLMKTPISKSSVKPASPAAEPVAAPRTDRGRDTLLYTRDDQQPHAKIDHVLQRHKHEKMREDQERTNKDKPNRSDKDTNSSPTLKNKGPKPNDSSSKQKPDKNTSKRNESNSPTRNQAPENRRPNGNNTSRDLQKDAEVRKRKRSDSQDKPGPVSDEPHTLLRGAVLVLSGYENPERAHVRNTALALGARVERDWAPHCTHLICAFPNTPKLRAVRAAGAGAGAGAVVVPAARAGWLAAVAARRRLLPWRWFATEPRYRLQPPPDLSLDDTPDPPPHIRRAHADDSGDTDDEIEKVLQQQKKRRLTESKEKRKSVDKENRPTDMSDVEDTEEEEEGKVMAPPHLGGALPDVFRGRGFLLHAAPAALPRLQRYVRAYGGHVLQMSAVDEGCAVDYIVRARSRPVGVSTGVCVSPAWLCACVAARTLLPTD